MLIHMPFMEARKPMFLADVLKKEKKRGNQPIAVHPSLLGLLPPTGRLYFIGFALRSNLLSMQILIGEKNKK
jgi:hypothetical protein